MLCCVDNDAYNGTFAKNPFHAKHNKLNFLALYVDGQQVPAKPLQPKFRADGTCVRSYLNLFAGTGKMFQDKETISRDRILRKGIPCLLLISHRIVVTVPIPIWYIKATCEWRCISMSRSSRRSTSSSTEIRVGFLEKHGHIMDTEQIERLLVADSYNNSVVVGALPKDCQPKTGIASYPAAFVCNTHSSDTPGQHWICMFFTNDGRGEYFDSYGLPPRQGLA